MRACCLYLSLSAAICLSACGSDLPKGTTEVRVGSITVRTDSMLDVIGVAFRLADTTDLPVRGARRHWFQSLQTRMNHPTLLAGRAPGPMTVSTVLETYAAGTKSDTVCGFIAPAERRCFTGNESVQRQVQAFLQAAPAFAPLTAGLDMMSEKERRRDLADVWYALNKSKSLDSAVAAYSGYTDLRYDVTLARTLTTGITTSLVDPARQLGDPPRIFLTPDGMFNERSFRSPAYIFLSLGHQMAHVVVRRLFAEHPELMQHGFVLRNAVSPEMAKLGYDGVFWDEILGEQLARAISIRLMQLTMPTIGWAARSQTLMSPGLAIVPYLEDALIRYEGQRAKYPTLASFAGELAKTLDSIPTDPCQAAAAPGLALVGVARHRAVVGFMADSSPFRAKQLQLTDTVVAIDGDSVSAGGLLVPSRQANLAWAQHLPYELGILDIRRAGHDYRIQVPINWVPRLQVRIASAARTAPAPADSLPICRWVTRARRPQPAARN
jgi:hypothetical protein